MKPKLSNLMMKKTICAALFFLVGFSCRQTICLAEETEPAGNGTQVEAVVINVDQWAVYVPNQVFYFDTNGDKRKIESLRRAANRLRNRKALITFYSTGDRGLNKRAILADIVPAVKKPNTEKPVQEAAQPPADSPTNPASEPPESSSANAVPGPPAGSSENTAPKPPEEKPRPAATVPAKSPISDKQVAAFVEALRLSAPHTGRPDDGLYSDWKVKPGNILRWSKQCMGRQIDPEEFAANPQEAREILSCQMGKILREQYAISNDIYVAVCRAAAWWMTGDPGLYDTPPTSSYATKVLGYYMRTR
jgi:hypothetical protein